MAENRSKIDQVYSMVEGKDVGFEVTYAELMERLEASSRDSVRTPVYKAAIRLEKAEGKTLCCILGRGYTVANAVQSLDGIKGRQRKGAALVRRAQHTAAHLATADWTPEENIDLREQLERLNHLAAAHEMRHNKIEAAQEIYRETVERRIQQGEANTAAVISAFRERLRIVEETSLQDV